MKNGISKKTKVYVAMSGGVDSSVSAALLKEGGYEVTGVYMRQWSPKVLSGECLWKQDRQDAMRVSAKLGISFLTWDYAKEYEKQVGKYMIDSYKKGITPNPDVMCNKVIKFGLFYDRAIKAGADFVATGHYARTSLSSNSLASIAKSNFSARHGLSTGHPCARKIYLARSVKLLKAIDNNKDQTYFLYTLKKQQLSKILFPIGNLEKSEVRKLAKKFGLENAEKKDSQGVCFIGPLNMKKFLTSYIKPKQGNIVLIKNKKIIGTHDGVYYYTIGQRHGLDIKDGGGPYFVVKKDIKKNIIFVGTKKDLLGKSAKVINISWINKPGKFPAALDVQIRYRSKCVKAVLDKSGNLIFKKPQHSITSGQSAVFYCGKEILGGGIIA
jgi:tRNA-specific 2-thiouridylase